MFDNFFIRIILRLLPDWQDAEAVRQFALRLLGYAADMAKETATEIDDKIVAVLEQFANDQALWAAFYGLIIDFFNGDESIVGNPRVLKLADDAKIDPAIIIAIITAIIEFIKWWKNRNA